MEIYDQEIWEKLRNQTILSLEVMQQYDGMIMEIKIGCAGGQVFHIAGNCYSGVDIKEIETESEIA